MGIAIVPTEYSISIAELAPAVEQRGFDSLWVGDHTHIPKTGISHMPMGGQMPEEYFHFLDQFVALTVAATVTTKLKLGTSVCVVAEHHPIDLAKRVATIDHVSGGRLLFGVGAGWHREAMANFGVAFESRWSILRERIEAMKEIWTEDEAEYHGDLVEFDAIFSWPKPVQKPHPPIYYGGAAYPGVVGRILDYADGWLVPGRASRTPEAFAALLLRVRELGERAQAAGRETIPITAIGHGMPSIKEVEGFDNAGFERVIYFVPPNGRPSNDPTRPGRDEAIRQLELIHKTVSPYLEEQ